MGLVPIRHVIDGEETDSLAAEVFGSVDPATREPYAEVALGSAADVDRAVTSARKAFDEGPWPRMGTAERGRLIHRLADLVEAHADELALADTTDMGKPIDDARAKDVPRCAQNLRFFADHARLTPAEQYPMDSGHHAYSRYEAAGVVAAIAPWNFPLMLESWKIAPALAWGNTVVLKPAEDTPASATLLARLATEAGLPPGVLNVVHGYGPGSAGEALTAHPGVDRITFTGESTTGRIISEAAARRLVPVSLELGGKGANVVFADADLDAAVDWSIGPDAPLQREEIFGPLVTITPFDDEAEAVRLANDTPYGLNAMLFTENVSRAHRMGAALRTGTVWVNCFFVRDLRAPFGGVGDSGVGREGGTFSREFFTEPKAVVMAIRNGEE